MGWLETATRLKRDSISFVIITMTSTRGQAPQDPGAKAIVSQNGLESGTVGGGKVEARAIIEAQEMLNISCEPKNVTWNLQTDIGMTCGGEVSFLFESFPTTPWPIVIFGAGHVAQALTRTLANLNCQVICIDSRKEWIDKLETKAVLCPEPAEYVTKCSPNSYFISVTQGHAYDTPILKAIARHAPDCPYVGVIGSDIKGKKIKSELLESGVSQHFIDKLRVPIGLPIGTNDPYEIAISITAELLKVRGN